MPLGLPVGAIYGVFKALNFDGIKNGDEIVAAGYALFSTALQFVFCTRTKPVTFSQYCISRNTWVTYINNHRRPSKGISYAVDEGGSGKWSPLVATFVAQHLRGSNARWMNCTVADVHQHLLNGGCFLYPSTSPTNEMPFLVFDAIPMAFIWENSGKGAALSTELYQRVLEISIPRDMQSRCGVILLGEEEAVGLQRVRTHAPLFNGGVINEKIKVKETAQTDGIHQEVSLLRAALVVGAVFNILVILRSTRF